MESWCAEGDKTVMNVNRMMLRFRPIAPKPPAGGSASGADQAEKNNPAGLKSRTKRKYVRVRRNSGYKRTKKELSGQDGDDGGFEKEIVTLQLLPEKAEQEVEEERWWCSIDGTVRTRVGVGRDPPTWTNRRESEVCSLPDLTTETGHERVVESWVTVECVTDTCNMDVQQEIARGMRSTERECVKIHLEEDTCPVLISDGSHRVEWVNEAYRKMVRQGNDRQLRVGLVVKERLPSVRGFSCRVRVQYLYANRMMMIMGQQDDHHHHQQWSQMVVPCDVWKINGGGFAWRLDIEAALSLGR